VDITASVVQGSSLGPASYIVTAADLRPKCTGNAIVKFADDTYLIIPAANSHTREDEVSHVETWAYNIVQLNSVITTNNLQLLLICSTMQMMRFYVRYCTTKNTFFTRTCLSDLTFYILCVLDNTTKILYPKLAILTIDIS